MSRSGDRLPYSATAVASSNLGIRELPVSMLLDQVRSLYNVGAFFRLADAAGIARLYLTGITAHPPHRALSKTALGAEETVSWEHHWNPALLLERLREEGHEIAAIETSVRAVDLSSSGSRASRLAWYLATRSTASGPSWRSCATSTSASPCSAASTR